MFLSKESIERKKTMDIFIYPAIAFTVIIFNLIAIFGLDILIHDDQFNYTRVLTGEIPWHQLKQHLIRPFSEWIPWNIMAYSPSLARGLYVLLLMIPLSYCFYYLLRYRLGFSKVTAYTAAVLPLILPMQWQIPAGINMSYVLWGLLVSVLSLILGLHYLEKDSPRNRVRLASAILCYFIATQIMEQALFLFPPFFLAFWGYKKFAKKNIRLMLGFTIIAAIRFIQMMVFPRAWATPAALSIDEILNRILLYFQWSLPFPSINPVHLVIIFMGIISGGFIFYLKQPDAELKNNRVFLYILLLVWSISTIFAFIFMSPDYTPRYTFISSFGLNAIFVFSIYVILKNVSHGKFKWHIPIFVAIVIFSGVLRYFTLKEMYAPWNLAFSIVQRDINKRELPLSSQIVIIGVSGTPGGWKYSSGYLQFALKRKDVTGLVGTINSRGYYNFDNHFDPSERKWGLRYFMSGLSLDQPVYLFLVNKKKGILKQLEYALQWRGTTNNAPWTIFRFDKITGKSFPFASGNGMEEYVSTIDKLTKIGLPQSSILWGGPPTKEEQWRLVGGIR